MPLGHAHGRVFRHVRGHDYGYVFRTSRLYVGIPSSRAVSLDMYARVQARVRMCTDMRTDMCIDTFRDTFTDTFIDTCRDMCAAIHRQSCIGTVLSSLRDSHGMQHTRSAHATRMRHNRSTTAAYMQRTSRMPIHPCTSLSARLDTRLGTCLRGGACGCRGLALVRHTVVRRQSRLGAAVTPAECDGGGQQGRRL